ncbi:MAG: hypothetical protein J6S71_10875 [Clostridia bacterium]|nr:hypothetical protein [Clostridia bacterium]
MKRIALMIVIITFCLSGFSGCGRADVEYASYSSALIGCIGRDDPYDDVIEEKLLTSEAQFAYQLKQTGDSIVQSVYVWHNLLRRELRLDIIQLWDVMPNEDHDIILTVDGEAEEIKINNKKIDFTPTSELSFAVFRAIFPSESRVNAKDFHQKLWEMIVRLETVEHLGDYEVIAIYTTADSGLLLYDPDVGANDTIIEVMHIDEILDDTSDGNDTTN